jgi:hypothetical protein
MHILESPRWRRRLTITGVVSIVLAVLIYLGVHFSTPGNSGAPNGPEVAGYTAPKHAPFTDAKKRAVRRVLRQFISTAVVRHDVGRSWDIVAGDLKAGMTRREWSRGEIPVVPYPASRRGWGTWTDVRYSYAKTLGLEVFLFPKPGSGYSAMTANVELVKGHDGNWRVDYWMPDKFHGPPSATAKAKVTRKVRHLKHQHAKKQEHAAKASGQRTHQTAPAAPQATRTTGAWWTLPLAFIALIVLTPLVVFGISWYRNRRAKAAYLRWRGQ